MAKYYQKSCVSWVLKIIDEVNDWWNKLLSRWVLALFHDYVDLELAYRGKKMNDRHAHDQFLNSSIYLDVINLRKISTCSKIDWLSVSIRDVCQRRTEDQSCLISYTYRVEEDRMLFLS